MDCPGDAFLSRVVECFLFLPQGLPGFSGPPGKPGAPVSAELLILFISYYWLPDRELRERLG